MEHIDEHEMLIEYSEMTTFNFNSEEFQNVRKDYVECKNFVASIAWNVTEFINKFRAAQSC